MTKCRLSWDSYQKNISSGLSALQHNGEFVDMTLATAGYLVKVHKNLLALASPYIKAMIQATPCQHPVIFLSNIKEDILGLILEYVYTGEVEMPTQKMEPFFKACQDLHIIGIQNVAHKVFDGVSFSNINEVEDHLDKPNEMIPLNNGMFGNLFSKDVKIKESVANASTRNNSVAKNTAGKSSRSCKLTDRTGFVRANKRFSKDPDQLKYQSYVATNSEGEASASSENYLAQMDTVPMTVNEEQKYDANTGIIEVDNDDSQPTSQSGFQVVQITDLETSVFNESQIFQNVPHELMHNDSNPQITEHNDVKLLTKSTEDFEHNIGVHVIDTVDRESKNTQKEQTLDSTAKLTLIPAPCSNQSNCSNYFVMTNNATYVKDTNRITDNIQTHSYNNENSNDCIDMELDITTENIDEISLVKLNHNDCNNLVGGTNVGNVQEYKETNSRKSIKTLESAPIAHTDSKANYSVNVELPRGNKGPPKITIMSGAIQNKPMPLLAMADHNTVSELKLPGTANSVEPKANPHPVPVAICDSAPLYMINGKSKLQMIFNRSIYCIHHTSQRSKRWRWRCIDYRHKRCLAYVDTIGDLIVDRKNVHSHPFHDKKIIDFGSCRRIFSSLKEIQELVGTPLDKLHNADFQFLNFMRSEDDCAIIT